MVAAALAKNIVPESREALRAAFTSLDDRLAALEAAGGAGKFFATAATTGALAAYTRVGAVITADANGALNPIDGQTLVAGTSTLWLKDGAAAADIALYDVTSIGGGGSKFVLTRNAEWDAAVGPGSQVFVHTGAVNKDKSWTITNDTAITAGTTAITFVLDPDAAALAATTGSAAIGHDAEATVKAGLDACTRAATLAAAGGAALVGSAVGGLNVEQRLAATEAVANGNNGAIKRTVTVGHADLTEAVAGTPQVVNIGAVLPANSRILSYNIHGTELTGGGTVSVGLDIGTAGDPNAIVAAADALTAFVDGECSSAPAGISPHKQVGAAQLIATFTPDGAHALADLTAGAVVIDIFSMPVA